MEVGPTASVSLNIARGAASIVFQHRRGSPLDGQSTTRALYWAFEQCHRQDKIAVVFLWAMGSSDNKGAKDATSDVPTFFDTTAEAGPPVEIQQEGLETLWGAIDRFPQPVIGVGDFAISGTGTRLLASCDVVLASKNAEFIPVSTNVNVDTAWKTGFVSEVLGNTVALLQECERLRRHLVGLPPKKLEDVKQKMRASRVSTLGSRVSCEGATVPHGATYNGSPQTEPSLMSSKCDAKSPWKLEAIREESPPLPTFLTTIPECKTSNFGPTEPYTGCTTPPGLDEKVSLVAGLAAMQAKPGQRAAARKRNLVSRFNSHDGPITTLMLSNLPCRVTQHQMVDVLDAMGFGDSYDLLYLPVGKPASKSGTSNLGYGFINFMDPDEALIFADVFQAYQFEGTNSSKLSTVKPAHIQGLTSFLQHFQRNARKHLPPGPLVHFGGKSRPARVSSTNNKTVKACEVDYYLKETALSRALCEELA
jgi:enoyl-CoA hydratase/carnithine racemase